MGDPMNDLLRARIVEALLGKPLLTNAFRGMVVEAMIAEVLEPEWSWEAADWGSVDFIHATDRTGLEVKQSAVRQSWHEDGQPPSKCTFDIRARTGRYEGAKWFAEPGRAAAIYVFANHPIFDPKIADHRIAEQWQFFVVSADALPAQKTIGLARVSTLAQPVMIGELADEVGRVKQSIG